MKTLLLLASLSILFSCNSSAKKDPNQAMDDTARMDHPPLPIVKIEPVKGSEADIPSTIKLKGRVTEVWKWKDTQGENLLVLTTVEPYDDPQKNQYGEEGQTAELHAFHYAGTGGNLEQLWVMSDAEKACAFDITCRFIKDAVTITDLDADGLAETKLQYRISCRSDVSPATTKLIMYEGKQKFALRGLSWYGMGEAAFDITETNACLENLSGYKGTEDDLVKTFGRYESEKDFMGAPPEFLSHARYHWIRFVKESSE